MPKQPENTPMEPEHAKFEEIINTVSPDEMRNPPPSEERGKNIAVFARFIANAHPGWPSFPEEIRDRFRREIENLYNRNGNGPENLLKEMEKTLIRSIPDNHAFILNPDKSRALDENESAAVDGKIIDKAPTPETGDNSAYSLAETPACKTLFRSGTEDFPLAIFEKRDRSGNKIGIVSLTKCPPPGDEKYNSEALKKCLPTTTANGTPSYSTFAATKEATPTSLILSTKNYAAPRRGTFADRKCEPRRRQKSCRSRNIIAPFSTGCMRKIRKVTKAPNLRNRIFPPDKAMTAIFTF